MIPVLSFRIRLYRLRAPNLHLSRESSTIVMIGMQRNNELHPHLIYLASCKINARIHYDQFRVPASRFQEELETIDLQGKTKCLVLTAPLC